MHRLLVNFCISAIACVLIACQDKTSADQRLITAIQQGNLDGVATLLAQRADVNAVQDGLSPLCIAAMYQQTEIALELVNAGAELHNPDTRETPLHLAAFNGNTTLIEFLIDQGADVSSTQAEYGMTPLQNAASMNQVAAVRCLLNAGADVFQQDDAGRTAYDVAIHHGFAALAESLKQEMDL